MRYKWAIPILLCVLTACSTKKNTSGTRFYHSMTAQFNTLYNGEVAFLEGKEAQKKGHRDDYTRLLPMYISTNKSTQKIGASNYDTSIEKCEKAIKVHSIKKKPIRKGNKKMTPKEKEFMSRKEYNPYLYHAWMMMAEAQFNKGEFIEAASTYNYILRLYGSQPKIASVARARMARCYVAMNWPYDADDIFRKIQRDSLPVKGVRELNNAYAAYLIETNQHQEAIPYLKKAIKSERDKLSRARMNFLLGQLYHEQGDNTAAYKALGRVVRANPPYELAFNARILQSEVMSGSKYRQMLSRLKRMAKSTKNEKYLDQVYYAIGNIYLSVEDTAHCIGAWEKGVEKATQSGPSKASLLLCLSQLYWERGNFIDAARTYKACASILDKEHDAYKEVQHRSKVLGELEPHLVAIHLQDSLQELAQMDSTQCLAAIDRVIEALKKKEKEEAKLKAKQEAAQNAAGTNASDSNKPRKDKKSEKGSSKESDSSSSDSPNTEDMSSTDESGSWYFYNTNIVETGKRDFQKKWGKRENEDCWRISHKGSRPMTSSQEEVTEETEETNETSSTPKQKKSGKKNKGKDTEQLPDSIQAQAETDSTAILDSLAKDPHNREYYLKVIPFTEAQVQASNKILADALYSAGILEQEGMENFTLAEASMQRLLQIDPEYKERENVYYHLFLLYGRMGELEKAQLCRDSLTTYFPEGKYAQMIGNPNYEWIAKEGKHIEDSVYATTYEAYQNSEYEKVGQNYEWSSENFPQGVHRARLMFIHAMSLLYTAQRDSFQVVLKEIIEKYPQDAVTEMANSIARGIAEGRPLMDKKYDTSNVWTRRLRTVENDSVSMEDAQFSEERYGNFAFVLAYPTGSIDEDQLFFEISRYNFSNYKVRNFEIETQDDQGLMLMMLKGFRSFDEVHAYAQKLYADERMGKLLQGMRTILVLEENLQKIGKEFSFEDYEHFYEEKFAPLDIPENLMIDAPSDVKILDPDEADKAAEEEEAEEETETQSVSDDDFPFGF